MVDKGLLYNQLVSKFKNLTLHSIVNECFIKGLFDSSTVEDMQVNNKNDIEELSRYSYATLESLGGYNLLNDAIKNCTDSKQKLLLKDIDNICTEASKKAAHRVVNNTDTDNITNSNEVVSAASFTAQEMNDFVKNGEKIDTQKISEIICDKTKAVIQEEKEAFERDEELESQITDILVSGNEKPDESAEESFLSLESYLDGISLDDLDENLDLGTNKNDEEKAREASEAYNKYLNIVLDGNMPRHHVSLFSKIQEAAVESILRYDGAETDLMDIVNHITFESFLSSIKKPITANTCIESLIQMQKDKRFDNTSEINMGDVMKKSMMCSTIIYTAMETLNTLNLFTPSRAEIKDFVDRSQSKSKSDKVCIESFDRLIQEELGNFKNEIAKESSISLLTDIYTKLTQYKEDIDLITLNGNEMFSEARESTLNTLDELIKNTKSKIEGKHTKALESSVSQDNGYYSNLKRREDLSQFIKINSLIAKRPNVKKIQLHYNPANESLVSVVGLSDTGSVIAESFMHLKTLKDSNALESNLTNLFLDSVLSECDQRVSLYCKDGSGQEIIIK